MKIVFSLVCCFAVSLAHAQDTPDVAAWREAMDYSAWKLDYDKAIEKLKEAIALNPHQGMYYDNLSSIYFKKKDYENAMKMADKAVDVYPKWNDSRRMVLVEKGRIMDAQGKPKDAAVYLENLLPVFEGYFQAYYLNFQYGEILQKLDRYDDAERAYIRSLKIYFYNNECQLRLAELKAKKHEKLQALLSCYMYLCIGGKPEGVEWAKNYLLQDDTVKKFRWTRLIANSQSLFNSISAVQPPDKDLKDPFLDVYATNYIPFFTDLYNSGHAEAFCYYFLVGTLDDTRLNYDQEIAGWIRDHQDKMNAFYSWLDPYRRK